MKSVIFRIENTEDKKITMLLETYIYIIFVTQQLFIAFLCTILSNFMFYYVHIYSMNFPGQSYKEVWK